MRLARWMMCALSLAALTACGKEQGASDAAPAPAAASAPPRLEPLWTTTGFSAPEGVAQAPGGLLFISNVAGDGEAKDGEGWITLLAMDGAISTERFAEGLNAPKGMSVHDGALFVADIDVVRRFDLLTGAALGEIAIEGAQFLNDVATWNGAVYVSDSQTGRIHRLTADGSEVWREGDDLAGVNGLLADGDRLLISTMKSGALIEATASGGSREIATGMLDADGIGLAPGGGYIVSSWPGQIHFVAEDGAVSTLLDTRDTQTLQNDVSVFGDIVIAPNWLPGTVTAWRLVR